MSGIYKCDNCKTPIAVGHIESGELEIRCKRCGQKTLVVPEKKAA